MKSDFYKTPKSTPLMRFFWKAAGGDRYILERATYSDQIKYMCLGGIVVATGAMAALAGGYAFYTIFEPRGSAIERSFDLQTSILAIVFGSIWGLIIFNIDRFIVTSTGKGDGTEAITWSELKSAFPRIIMGAIIALTISKPVEIRMFKTEIDTALYEKQQTIQKDFEIRTRANYEERLKDLAKDNATIQLRIDDYLNKISVKDSLYNVETSSGQGGRIKGEGPVALALKNERDRLKVELDTYITSNKSKIDDIEKRRKRIYEEMDVALGNNQIVASGLDGLLERIKLAHEIAGPWISLFITLLFMAIELTPIFFKLMLIKSPYDYLEENTKELMKAKQGIYIQYNYYKDKQGLERDLVRFLNVEKEILQQEKLLEAQKRLTEYAIAKYEDQLKKKIDASPESFIKVDNSDSFKTNGIKQTSANEELADA